MHQRKFRNISILTHVAIGDGTIISSDESVASSQEEDVKVTRPTRTNFLQAYNRALRHLRITASKTDNSRTCYRQHAFVEHSNK